MKRDMKPRGRLDCQRGLGKANGINRGFIIKIFLTVPFNRGNPPCGGGLGNCKLGKLLNDIDLLEIWLIGKFISETNAVIINAEHDIKAAPQRTLLGKTRAQFVEVVSDRFPLTPRLIPAFINAAA